MRLTWILAMAVGISLLSQESASIPLRNIKAVSQCYRNNLESLSYQGSAKSLYHFLGKTPALRSSAHRFALHAGLAPGFCFAARPC